jgi:FdhD protein
LKTPRTDHPDSPGLFRWTAVRRGETAPEEGFVVVEAPLEVAVGEHLVAVLMQTPGLEKELAVGYCVGEGILSGADAIAAVDVEEGQNAPLRVVVRPRESVTLDADALSQPRFIRSGCAADSPGDWACTLPPLGEGIHVTDAALHGSLKALIVAQEAYRVAGGIHAAGVFSASGEAVVTCEDIGRHNAVDKALGSCILRGIPLADKFLLGTGRASYEFVTKSARVGVSLVASLSSPTSLSVGLADVLNQTLIGYLRSNRFTVYTHAWRIG